MDYIKELLKFPFLRLLPPIVVGVFAHICIVNEINSMVDIKDYLDQHGTERWFLFFVLGELLSLSGELIVNYFFNYFPICPMSINNLSTENNLYKCKCIAWLFSFFRRSKKDNSNQYFMEKSTLACDAPFIPYKEFVKKVGKDFILIHSEIHFVMSRFFCGLMSVFLIKACFIAFFIIVFCFWVLSIINRFMYNDKNPLIVLFAVVIILPLLEYNLCCGSILKYQSFAIICLLGAIYYRSHANLLLLYINSPKEERNQLETIVAQSKEEN